MDTQSRFQHRFYFSFYSLVLVSIEMIYQTLETVFHWLSKLLIKNFIKNTPLCIKYFQLPSRCLTILMNYCLECLIYYLICLLKERKKIHLSFLLLKIFGGCESGLFETNSLNLEHTNLLKLPVALF